MRSRAARVLPDLARLTREPAGPQPISQFPVLWVSRKVGPDDQEVVGELDLSALRDIQGIFNNVPMFLAPCSTNIKPQYGQHMMNFETKMHARGCTKLFGRTS